MRIHQCTNDKLVKFHALCVYICQSAALKQSFPPKKWSELVNNANSTKQYTTDITCLTAQSVLDLVSEDDQMELLKTLLDFGFFLTESCDS